MEDKEIKHLLKQYIDREIRDPEFIRSKKNFIREHFRPENPLTLKPVWAVPAFGLVLTCAIFVYIHSIQVKPVVTEPAQSVSMSVPEKNTIKETIAVSQQSGVIVEQVSSDMGSPVVYQKDSNGTPLTVVWVLVPKNPIIN